MTSIPPLKRPSPPLSSITLPPRENRNKYSLFECTLPKWKLRECGKVVKLKFQRSAVFVDQPRNPVCATADGKKQLIHGWQRPRGLKVVDLLANIGIGMVFPIRSSSLATSVPILTCTGNAPVALGAAKWKFFDKVSLIYRISSVECQKSFHVVLTDSKIFKA